jgi:hypothetical protein
MRCPARVTGPRELASAAFGLSADIVLGAEIPFAKLYNL